MGQILDAVRERQDERTRIRQSGYTIRLFDGLFGLRYVVSGEDSLQVQFVENDTGGGKLELDENRDAARWLWNMRGRYDDGDTMDAYVAVDYVGLRWTGRVSDIGMHVDDMGATKVTAELEHDYEQLKARTVWATPITPAGFQPFKIFMLGGPAQWAAATALWFNLQRAHGWPGGVSWLDPVADRNADYRAWPVVIEPFSFQDAQATGVVTGLVTSRFKTWHECTVDMLNDADVTVHVRRYLPGDDLPWPEANLQYGTLVVSFEYQGGVADDTIGGLIGGVGQLVRTFLDAAVESLGAPSFLPVETGSQQLQNLPPVPEYDIEGYLGSAPKRPYVIYPHGAEGIVEFEAHKQPAKYLRFTTGGKSAPGVNELIGAAIEGIGAALATIPLVPDLGGVANELLKPFYMDTVLAFMTVYLQGRWDSFEGGGISSPLAPYEAFLPGADQAYTLSATMVLRTGVRQNDPKFSAQLSIIDGAPWWVGADGIGDMHLGTRIWLQSPAAWDDQIYSQRITKLQLEGKRGQFPQWTPTVGDIDLAKDPFSSAISRIKKLMDGLQQVGVF